MTAAPIRGGDAPLAPACQYGPSGHCLHGRHYECAHSVGGPQEFGHRSLCGGTLAARRGLD